VEQIGKVTYFVTVQAYFLKFSTKVCQYEKQHLSQKSEMGKNAEMQFMNDFPLASE